MSGESTTVTVTACTCGGSWPCARQAWMGDHSPVRITSADGVLPVTAADGAGPVDVACTCGPGAWGTCDQCEAEAWVHHHCPFPCDDVTCENGSICIGCLTGRPCPVHNDDWDDEQWDEDWIDWEAGCG